MFNSKKSEALLARIREGMEMSRKEKLSLIVALSVPSMLAQVTSVLMFFIDASMVGHLGASATASIGLIESTTWLMGSVMSAMAMGFSVQVAHFIGANDFSKARQVFRHSLVCGAIFSVVMMLIGVLIHNPLPHWLGGGEDVAADASRYFTIFALAVPFMQFNNLAASMLKCEGSMRVASTMSVTLCVLDMLLNFFLIFPTRQVQLMGLTLTIPGAGLYVTGAAMGTALAYMIVMVVQSWMVFWRSPMLSLRRAGEPFVYMGSYIWQAVKISVPMGFQSMLMGGAQVVSTMIVAPLGNIAIAANTFAITAESLCYMPGYGIGEAATTLVGQSKGAGRLDLCRSFAWMTVGMGMAVMALMGAVMFVFAPALMALMTPVAEIKALGAQVLRIEAFAEPMFAASIVAYSVCVGAGDTLRPAVLNLMSMWCVRLTLAFWLARDYGLQGVWTAMAIELTLRGLLFLVRIWRGHWMKKLSVS